MKKLAFCLLVIFQFSLLLVFVVNQYGIGPAWSADEKASQEEQEEKESTTSEKIAEVEESTTAVIIPEKKPEGMSDLEWEKLKAKKPLPFDKGPEAIDISKYPKEMQDTYKNVFIKTCSKCHTIARAINAPYALPEEWMAYIRKMMKKPGSGIIPSAAKKIYEFLVYDSSIRKKDIIEKKLKEKAEEEKKETIKEERKKSEK